MGSNAHCWSHYLSSNHASSFLYLWNSCCLILYKSWQKFSSYTVVTWNDRYVFITKLKYNDIQKDVSNWGHTFQLKFQRIFPKWSKLLVKHTHFHPDFSLLYQIYGLWYHRVHVYVYVPLSLMLCLTILKERQSKLHWWKFYPKIC